MDTRIYEKSPTTSNSLSFNFYTFTEKDREEAHSLVSSLNEKFKEKGK
ncbi:12705_t:CDS:2, partial [Acaulospora morrowiae]